MNKRKQSDRRAIKSAVANIIAVYLDAPELTREAGRHWYRLERERCTDFAKRANLTQAYAGKHSSSARDIAGAAAAISPGLRWEYTFAHVEALLQNPSAKVPTYCRENVRRAVRCLRGEDPASVLRGPKVRAFYGLLSGTELDAVVIDGHAWNICTHRVGAIRNNVPPSGRVTERRYRIAAQAFRDAGEILGEAPHGVQAATWLHWRNLMGDK